MKFGLFQNKLDFQDFLALVGNDVQKLNKATLGFKGVKENLYIDKARETIENLYWFVIHQDILA